MSRQALEMGKAIFGPEHLHTAELYANLAFLHRSQGDFDTARRLFRQALQIKEKKLGYNHPSTHKTLNNLYIAILGEGLGLDFRSPAASMEMLRKINQQQGGAADDSGMLIIGMPGVDEKQFDIPVIAVKDGVKRIRRALDLLQRRSPHSRAALDKLRKAGQIVIIYDPAFPPRDVSSMGAKMASFFSNLFVGKPDPGGGRIFPVVVSRYIVKWDINELAFALAHELIGHGIQHLKGRLPGMDRTDSECEARLYQEMVHQDLEIDKHGRIMVNLRQELENRWCAPFIKYMKQRHKESMDLWRRLHPDVPGLLAIFEEYLVTKITR